MEEHICYWYNNLNSIFCEIFIRCLKAFGGSICPSLPPFFHQNEAKTCKTSANKEKQGKWRKYIKQQILCRAPICWSKYTANNMISKKKHSAYLKNCDFLHFLMIWCDEIPQFNNGMQLMYVTSFSNISYCINCE